MSALSDDIINFCLISIHLITKAYELSLGNWTIDVMLLASSVKFCSL